MCREKSKLFPVDDAVKGSPPHMRGKGQNQRGTGSGRGITPAYAGKSGRESGTRACCRDHPRVCGEKTISSCRIRRNSGSPPRVRGKVGDLGLYTLYYGITPARAGKSLSDLYRWGRRGDHPRVCGEKVPITCVPKYALGLPPHVRGKVAQSKLGVSIYGITPAYAGKRIDSHT